MASRRAGLDQDTKQGVAVEHRLRQGHRHDRQLVGVHAQPLAADGEHADHANAPIAHAHQLTERGFVPNISPRTLAPITTTAAPRLQSPGARKRPWAESHAAHREVLGAGASTITSRSRPPALISDVPTANGATA